MQPAFPAGNQLRWQEGISLQETFPDFFQRRNEERDTEDDEEGELKTRTEKLARVVSEDDEPRDGEGIEQVAGTFERPAADDDGHHDGGTDGGRLPAGGVGIKPDQRDDDRAAPESRHLHHPQERDEDSGDEGDVQPAD